MDTYTFFENYVLSSGQNADIHVVIAVITVHISKQYATGHLQTMFSKRIVHEDICM